MDSTTSPSTSQPKTADPVMRILMTILLLLVGFGIAGGVFYLYPLRQKIVEKPVVKTEVATMPPTAVRVSGCVPHMGEHWVELSNLPRGPYYVVNGGRVIGLEYMFKTNEMPNEIGSHMSKEAAQKYAKENKLTFGAAVQMAIPGHIDLPVGPPIKTWDIEWSAPHAGLVEPHYDAHFYYVEQKELDTICPDAPFGSELPPEMATELKRLGVPLP